MRYGDRDKMVLYAILGAFAVASAQEAVEPLTLVPAGAAAYGFSRQATDESILRSTVAVAAVSAVVLGTSLPSYVLSAAVLSVVGGEIAYRAAERYSSSQWNKAVAYLLGGLAGAVSVPYMTSGEAAAVAFVAVSCVYTAAAVASLDAGVEWSLLAAGVAGVLSSAAPIAPGLYEVVLAASVTLAFGAAAYHLEVMTLSGSAAGVLLSYVLMISGGAAWFLVLGAFVVVGTFSTRYGSEKKQEMGYGHDDPRSVANVASNGSVAFVLAVAYAFALGWTPGYAGFLEAAFAASIATASADTASSEIGVVHGEPRMLTDLEPVEPGVDGGVSAVGLTVALAASTAVAVLAFLLGALDPMLAVAVAVAGFVGCNVDSLLGATLEGELLDNETVNLTACAAGATAVVLIAPFL